MMVVLGVQKELFNHIWKKHRALNVHMVVYRYQELLCAEHVALDVNKLVVTPTAILVPNVKRARYLKPETRNA